MATPNTTALLKVFPLPAVSLGTKLGVLELRMLCLLSLPPQAAWAAGELVQ